MRGRGDVYSAVHIVNHDISTPFQSSAGADGRLLELGKWLNRSLGSMTC
jgi:hypothetical protein